MPEGSSTRAFDPASFARRYRIREIPELGVPEGSLTYWGEAGRAWLPHPVDEIIGAGGLQGFLFTGPAGTGKYTTAMQLAGILLDRGWKAYYLTADVFDPLGETERESAFEELLGAQEAVAGAETGHVVLLHFPEDAARKRKLQLALTSAMETCESLECKSFLFVITGKPSCIREKLLRKLTYCEFTLPDEEERERYLRTAFEAVFRYSGKGGAAAEQAGRTKLVRETEGFSYTQLRQLILFALQRVKRRTIDRIGYDPDKVREEMTKADYFVLEAQELEAITRHVRRIYADGTGSVQAGISIPAAAAAAAAGGAPAKGAAGMPGAPAGQGSLQGRLAFGQGSDLQKAYEKAVKIGDMLSQMGI